MRNASSNPVGQACSLSVLIAAKQKSKAAGCKPVLLLIPSSADQSSGLLLRANLFQTAAKVLGINSRGVADGPVIPIVIKQKLFGLALLAKRAADPLFHRAGDHRAPQFLDRAFFHFLTPHRFDGHVAPCSPRSKFFGGSCLPLACHTRWIKATGSPSRSKT